MEVIEAGVKWKIVDEDGQGKNTYFLEKVVNNIGQNKLSVVEDKEFILPPWLFSIEMAGKLVLGIPNAEQTAIETEYFRLSGAFAMELSKDGLKIFVAAELHIGPPDFNIFNVTAVGLILINADGLSVNLELRSNLNLGDALTVEVEFFLILNTTSKDQPYRVPDRFLSEGYLSQKFIDQYIKFGMGDVIGQVGTDAASALNGGTLPDNIRLLMLASLAAGTSLGSTITVKKVYKDSWWEVSDGLGHDFVVRLNGNQLDVHKSLGNAYMIIPSGTPQA